MTKRRRWSLVVPLIALLSVFGCDKGDDESEGGEGGGGGGAAATGGGGGGQGGGENMYTGEALLERPELARRDIRGMMDRSRGYFDRFGQFPTSAPLTPAEPPCGPEGSAVNSADWEQPTWSALRFVPRDPHHYSYQYDSTGTGETGTRFLVTAIGDLDCDGVRSTFQRGATTMADGVIDSDDEVAETNRDE